LFLVSYRLLPKSVGASPIYVTVKLSRRRRPAFSLYNIEAKSRARPFSTISRTEKKNQEKKQQTKYS